MAAKKSSTGTATTAATPEAAYLSLKGRLVAMDRITSRARIDTEAAANVVLGAVEFLAAPAQANRLSALPKEEWDESCVVDARLAALAVRYCRALASSLEARESSALVPASVIDEVAALKRKAIKVLGYWVEDETVHDDLADIVTGSGYADATEDLERLATLLEEHGAAIQDRRYDVDGTVKRARALADLISGATRANSAAEWQRELRRSLTFLLDRYAEVTAAAQFLFRREPLKAARVPSVFSATRRAPRRQKTGAADNSEVATG